MNNNENERLVCSCCGAELNAEDYYEMQGELLCSDCYRNETATCEHCSERIRNEDNAGSYNMPLCQKVLCLILRKTIL
ncbi:MAG: LIM domain-containing protein [Oscillospiraceae bacterium]